MEPINSHSRRRENSKSLHCNSSEARDRGYKVRLIAVSQFFDKIQIFFCSVLGRLGKLMKRNVGKCGIRGRFWQSQEPIIGSWQTRCQLVITGWCLLGRTGSKRGKKLQRFYELYMNFKAFWVPLNFLHVAYTSPLCNILTSF